MVVVLRVGAEELGGGGRGAGTGIVVVGKLNMRIGEAEYSIVGLRLLRSIVGSTTAEDDEVGGGDGTAGL